jgi:hypothetical protein
MYARVARWEGGDAEAIRRSAQEIQSRAASGPPEGVPSVGFTLLVDPEGGRAIAIGMFETEDDLREGDRVLNEMSPPGDGMGRRAAIEVYEVPLDVRVGAAAQGSA